MGRKVNKAEAVDTITELRKAGLTVAQIGARLGIKRTQVGRYIKQFDIPWTPREGASVCPHCLRDIEESPDYAGGVHQSRL